MKQAIRSLLFCLMLGLCVPQVWATHYKGAEVSYSCIGGCTYRVLVTEYFDCSGILSTPAAPTAAISFLPVTSCVPATPTPSGAWVLASNMEVTPLAPYAIVNGTSCGTPGASVAGIRQLTYYRDYDFCAVTCPIEISVSSCCRNAGLINLANPGSDGYETHTTIWTPGGCNTGPVWLDPSYSVVEVGTPARISMAAFDADGDSLAYRIDTVFSANGIPVSYVTGFSADEPFGLTASVSLDAMTGDLILPASIGLQGEYSVGVSVSEYRDGNLLGVVRRDFTVAYIQSLSIAGDNPYVEPFGNSFSSPIGGFYTDSFTVKTAVGTTLMLPIQAKDFQAGDIVTMTYSENLPGATFTDLVTPSITDTVTGVNPVAALTWTPAAPGRYAFNVKLNDTSTYSLGIADYSFVIDVDSCDLVAEIGVDSAFICLGDSVILSPVVSGGTSPYQYLWSTGDTSPSFPAFFAGIYIVWVEDAIGCVTTDTVYVGFSDYCVWPGDADNDGVADNNDVLALGLTYGDTGPLRASANLTWTAQGAFAWVDSLPNGINSVFSDTDGSGLVNDDDTLAISLNYGLTHNKTGGVEGGPGDPPLLILPSVDSALVGDTVVLSIALGLDTLPADSIYGLAFTIEYDETLVDSGSASVQYSGWLGSAGINLLGFQKDFAATGELPVALTRTDLQEVSGFGMIASLSIVMIDDIAGKSAVSEVLHFSITQVRLIRLDGTEIPVQAGSTSIVLTELDVTSIDPELIGGLRIYPQPARDQVVVEIEQPEAWEVSLHTLSGQFLQRVHTPGARQLTLPLEGLATGLYILRIRSKKGEVVRKLEVRAW